MVHLGVSCDPGGVYTGLKRGLEYSNGQWESNEPSWRPVSLPIRELYPHIRWLYSLFGCLGGPLVHLGVSCDPGGLYTGLKPGLEYSHAQ